MLDFVIWLFELVGEVNKKIDQNIKPIYWLLTLFSVIIGLFLLPKYVLFSGNEIINYLIFLAIVVLMPYMVFKSIRKTQTIKKYHKIIVVLTPIIVMILFIFHFEEMEQSELEQNGVWTKAVVIEKKYFYTKRKKGWEIKCMYKVKDVYRLTNLEWDKNNQWSVGDSIGIVYSKIYPNVYKMEDKVNLGKQKK